MDILGPLPKTPRGNWYILVIGDYFTKWQEAFPLKDMEAVSVVRVLVNDFVCRFGVPESLHTDQGRNFESAVIKEVCKLLDIRKTCTTPYHPQSDGLVERFNRTLLDLLSMALGNEEHYWDLFLPVLLFAYTTSYHETTGTTPFELMFGRDPRLPEDVLYSIPVPASGSADQYSKILKERFQRSYMQVAEHAAKQLQHQKKSYDAGVRGTPYAVNDLVFLHTTVVPRGSYCKFLRPWKGPYKVVEVVGPTTYRIADCSNPSKKQVVHFNRLKPAPQNGGPSQNGNNQQGN